ncbi:hypothetical protein N0V90_003543 [Kalmusia sp. IMI 367209]|nr:hypothetical protein N0V90_003543 [Kalmusia sp. IMI 367209]
MVLSNSNSFPPSTVPLTVLVTAANGTQGYALCSALASLSPGPRPLQIRAVVRDASSIKSQRLVQLPQKYDTSQYTSVILTQADLTDVESLIRAFTPSIDGSAITAVFLNTVPTFHNAQEEVQHATAVLDAARAAGSVRHVVYSSVVGIADPQTFPLVGGPPAWVDPEAVTSLKPADVPSKETMHFQSNLLRKGECEIDTDAPTRKVLQGYFGAKAQIEFLVKNWRRDETAEDVSKTYTVLRPAWFMSNFLPPSSSNYWPELLSSQPVLRSAMPKQARLMLVDPADIGVVAAHALLDPINGQTSPTLVNKIINVGSQALGLEEAARILSAVAGVHIGVEQVGEREAANEIREGNVQRDAQAWALEKEDCFEPEDLSVIIGRKPGTFEAFLKGKKEESKAFFGRQG